MLYQVTIFTQLKGISMVKIKKKIKVQRIMTDSRVKRTYFFSTKMYHFKDFIMFYACKVGKKIALILLGYIYILCKKKPNKNLSFCL